MSFKEKLIRAMEERGVSQTQLSGMTGIGKSSISQYINGKNVPSAQRRRQIEKALSLAEGHLDEKRPDRIERMTVQECARVMGLSREKLVRALEAGICAPWGIYKGCAVWRSFFHLQVSTINISRVQKRRDN